MIPENIVKVVLACRNFCVTIFVPLDISITFIDKTYPSDLFKREEIWRRILKTMPCHLLGLILKKVFNVICPYIYYFLFIMELMAYMAARTGSFFGFEKLDTIIMAVCLEMIFGRGSSIGLHWGPVDGLLYDTMFC